MSTLIHLGRCVFTNLLNDWLKLVDICTFDCSLCNWHLRNAFQINYVWKKVDILQQSPFISESLIDWGFRHKFPIGDVILTNYYLSQKRKKSPFENVVDYLHNLIDQRISNMVLSQAFVFYTLTSLTLEGCQADNLSILSEILNNTSSLLTISLTNSEHITDSIVSLFTQRNPKLTSCDLQKTKITDKSIHKITKHCANISILNLNQCNSITIKSIELLAERCPNLLGLDVAGYARFSQAAALNYCESLPNLTDLNYSYNVDYGTIKTIGKYCPQLSLLVIQHGLPATSCARLLEVSPHYKNITKLHVYCCFKLTSDNMNTVCTNSPNISDFLLDVYYTEQVVDIAVVVCNKLQHLKKCTLYTSKSEDYFHLNLFRACVVIALRFSVIYELSLSKEFCLSGLPKVDMICCDSDTQKKVESLVITKQTAHHVLWAQIQEKCRKLTEFTFLRSRQTWLPDTQFLSQVTVLRLHCASLVQLMTLTKSCQFITELQLHCDDTMPVLHASFFEANSQLQKITLVSCSRAVTTLFLSAMVQNHMKWLKYLKFDKCAVMNKQTFMRDIVKLKFVHEIHFVECAFVDRVLLRNVLQNCKYLEKLRIAACANVNETALRWILYLYNNNVQLVFEQEVERYA